jgi:hypothetical protein
MLHQICERGRLLAGLSAAGLGADSLEAQAGAVLEGHRITETSAFTTTGPQAKTPRTKLPAEIYELLLAREKGRDPILRDHRALPHPTNARVLSPFATAVSHLEHEGRTFTTHTAHDGNSAVLFRSSEGTTRSGFVDAIWQWEHPDGQLEMSLFVRPHARLSTLDRRKDLYSQHPGLRAELVYSSQPDPLTLISPSDIISHTAYRVHPPGTFGIRRGVIVIVNLDRGRSTIVY